MPRESHKINHYDPKHSSVGEADKQLFQLPRGGASPTPLAFVPCILQAERDRGLMQGIGALKFPKPASIGRVEFGPRSVTVETPSKFTLYLTSEKKVD